MTSVQQTLDGKYVYTEFRDTTEGMRFTKVVLEDEEAVKRRLGIDLTDSDEKFEQAERGPLGKAVERLRQVFTE